MTAEKKHVEGVILAAGLSTRAGTFKPALRIGGKTLIERCVEGMRGVCDRIIVVGGHEFERLCSLAEGIENVECVQNICYRKGMFTSVKAGLSHVRGERCFVLPVDIPLVPKRVYDRLLSLDADIVIPAFGGRKGHPVCCSNTIIPRILENPDESTFSGVLRAIGFRTVSVDAEEILVDVDTPEEYERIRGKLA
jgi:molybdenum cofactor cytidylyltransferase